ncbi:hypothetical protein BRD17_09110 [Halobacteriales archaeon SW_7_68_16]|nr:MAG: hypothetical protein BRD17_09110 [Halobacteriales archaeon SW_7_68_16]
MSVTTDIDMNVPTTARYIYKRHGLSCTIPRNVTTSIPRRFMPVRHYVDIAIVGGSEGDHT